MHNIPTEIIALPQNADLDTLAAVRCLLLINPKARIIHPVKLRQNAWEIARKQSWFTTIPINNVDFSRVNRVHLTNIFRPQQNPQLAEKLLRSNATIVVYGNQTPELQFKIRHKPTDTLSLTAFLVNKLINRNHQLDYQDKLVFCSAISEKTWAGLSFRVTPGDLNALSFLRQNKLSARRISNSIVLGLREGQTGLYNHMLKNIQDIHPGNWPSTLISVTSSGDIQDLEPVVDAVWSDIGQYVLIIIVSSGGFSRVWSRSNLSQVDFCEIFRQYKPFRSRSWICFNLYGKSHHANQKQILASLDANLKPDITAADIMSVVPRTIAWDATVKSALTEMLKFNIMSLLVEKAGKFVGIICRRDLDRARQMELYDSQIGTWLSSSNPVVAPSTPVRVLKNIMVRYNITRLPVIENEEVKGIIGAHELLRALPDHLPPPPDYLPFAHEIATPEPAMLEQLFRQVFSLGLLHLLIRIGRFASRKNILAFAVGGFVRDLLLERRNLDIDIVIIGDAIPFAQELSQKLGCPHKVFTRFHTARIYIDDLKIDFSSARIEHYANVGALPQIEFSGLSSDLYRRDFTINALALAINEENFMQLKDYFGGFADLQARKLRVLHSFSFLEDPTRLFRIIRFASRFNFSLEKDTRRAFDLAINRDVVSQLSLKRIGAEISRCLCDERPHRIIAKLFSVGLMRYLNPVLSDTEVLPGRFRLIRGLVRRFAPISSEIDEEAIYWTGLLSVPDYEEAKKVIDAIGLPHDRRRIVLQSLEAMREVPSLLANIDCKNHVELYELLSKLDLETLLTLIAFSSNNNNSRKILYFIGELRGIKCKITGADLVNAGIPPGPVYGRIFEQIRNHKLKGNNLTRKEELELATSLYSSS